MKWKDNLWLWTVALHMYYGRRTLSLTAVDSWKVGVICEIVTPQRQDHIWSSPLAILLLQLRTAGLLSLKIEWANSISVQNWSYMWGRHTQRQCQDWQSPLAKLVFEKQNKTKQTNKQTGVICEVVTPKRQDQVWSSPLAMLLLKLRTAGLLSLKIEWANSISVQNWGYVWGRHTQRQCLNWQSPLVLK